MKKALVILLATAATLTLSCQTEQPLENVQEHPQEVLVQKDFSVSMPGSDTKTYLDSDGHTVKWSAGDKINVIAAKSKNQYTFTLKSGEGTASAVFTGSMTAEDSEDTKFYAVYPDVNVSVGDDAITFENSTNGDHRKYYNSGTKAKAIAGSFDPDFAPMFAASTDGNFAFQYGVAFFKLKVSAEGVKTVSLYAGGNGRFDGRPAYKPSTGATTDVQSAQRQIDVQPEAGTFDTAETYYIPVLTKASTVGDLTLTYTLSDGTTSSSKTSSSLSKTVLVSGKIYNLGTPAISFDPEIASSNVTIEAEDTGGTINFSVKNLKAGGYVVKNVTSDGLSNAVWGDVSFNSETGVGSVTFTCDENADTEDVKTATVHLFYTTDGSSELDSVDVTVTQKKAGAVSVSYSWGFTADNTSDTVANTTYSWESDTAGQTISYSGGGSDSITQYPSKSGIYCLKMNGDSGTNGSRRYFTYTAPSAGTLRITGYKQGNNNANLTVNLGSDTVTADVGSPAAFASADDPTECVYTISAAGTVKFYTDGKSYFKSVVFTN